MYMVIIILIILLPVMDWQGSLARIYAFVEKEREQYKENLILLDNGDILQGQRLPITIII